jgi:acyl-CoA thioesterase-1
MVELAHASGARVLLLGVRLPARYGAKYGGRFEDVLRGVAESTGATLVPRVLAVAGERDVADRDVLLQDGGNVHPNARGHALMLDNVWPALLPLLEADAPSGPRSSVRRDPAPVTP